MLVEIDMGDHGNPYWSITPMEYQVILAALNRMHPSYIINGKVTSGYLGYRGIKIVSRGAMFEPKEILIYSELVKIIDKFNGVKHLRDPGRSFELLVLNTSQDRELPEKKMFATLIQNISSISRPKTSSYDYSGYDEYYAQPPKKSVTKPVKVKTYEEQRRSREIDYIP